MKNYFQAPDTVLMIRPSRFGYNPETSDSNSFQNNDNADPNLIQITALAEFDELVSILRECGVNVMVVEDTDEPATPDAVFPNNWISTHHDGTVILYPMLAPSRRNERRSDILLTLQKEHNFDVQNIQDLSAFEDSNFFLEGTGSIVFDYPNGLAYANLSPRSHWTVLNEVCDILDFKPIVFPARDTRELDIYHTNVLMCIGDQFAVICLESIPDDDNREMVVESLEKTGHEIVDISFEQLTSFAGNMIQLKGYKDESFLVMSDSAFNSLSGSQKDVLEKYSSLIHSDLSTIEKYGGGSARCMITGIFLPKMGG